MTPLNKEERDLKFSQQSPKFGIGIRPENWDGDTIICGSDGCKTYQKQKDGTFRKL